MSGISHSPQQHEQDLTVRLDLFESEWRSGSAPDLRLYLHESESVDQGFLAALIQVDLEYRWKRYSKSSDRTSVDEHGFKMFPILEDYTELEKGSKDDILTADLFAEEYRVRVVWGDRPNREIYFVRFPGERVLLEVALDHVLTKQNLDCSTPNREADINGSGATVDFSNADSQTDREPTHESHIPVDLGRYQLKARIGRGGFGEVWKAYDPKLDRYVAIKFPRPDKHFASDVIADFAKEGRKLARLETIPGIVSVYDAGVCDGHAYIVSELIDGESLESRLQRKPRSSHQDIVQLIGAVAESLHRAHLKDLVHRDIKPGNILLRKDGSPVIADFGLAVTETEQLTESQGVVGTIAYMPPEQADGNSRFANAQADIYGLGVVLYQLLTGRLPFVADSFEEYREQIVNRPPRSPRTIDETIPEELERICLRCMEKRPEDRYASGRDLAFELRHALDRPKGRIVFITVGAAACLALIGLLVAASTYPWRTPKSPPSKDGASAPELVRENLLDRPPSEVIWDAGYEANVAGYSAKDKRFAVNSLGTAVFSLGRNNTSNHFAFRVRFIINDSCRRFGLMWGHGLKKQMPGNAGEEWAHGVRVTVNGGDTLVEIVEWKFPSWTRKRVQSTIGLSSPIKHKLQSKEKFEIDLELQDGAVKHLRIQDTEIQDVSTSKRLYQQGNLGILVEEGRYVITEAWYHNKKEKQ